MSATDGRCYTYQGVHIPGCWGCAIYGGVRGHAMSCDCPPRPRAERRNPLEVRIERMERQLMELRDKVMERTRAPLLEPVEDASGVRTGVRPEEGA